MASQTKITKQTACTMLRTEFSSGKSGEKHQQDKGTRQKKSAAEGRFKTQLNCCFNNLGSPPQRVQVLAPLGPN
jgi:hypothetical protein